MCFGQRQLHDVAVAGRVGVQLGDGRLDLLLRGVGRQVPALRGDAHLGAVAVLAVDVRLRARVLAHQDRAQPRDDAPVAERLDPPLQVVLDRRRRSLAIQYSRRHSSILPPGVDDHHAGPRARPIGPPDRAVLTVRGRRRFCGRPRGALR